MKPNLKAQLSGPSSFGCDQPIRLKFSLTNIGDGDWYVLAWYTPLEGLRSNCLKVSYNNELLQYDGIMMKRGNPPPEAYILLKPGGFVTSEFDIGSGYPVNVPGEYMVKFEKNNLECAKALSNGSGVLCDTTSIEVSMETEYAFQVK